MLILDNHPLDPITASERLLSDLVLSLAISGAVMREIDKMPAVDQEAYAMSFAQRYKQLGEQYIGLLCRASKHDHFPNGMNETIRIMKELDKK